MKLNKNFSIFFILMVFIVGTVSAQDDLYYNPDSDASYEVAASDDYDEYTYYEEEVDGDHEVYEDYEEYDYYYTSRIRRFRRPTFFGGFYSPFYTSARFYDPFAPFSVTVYDRWGYNRTYVNNYFIGFGAPRYSRWNRWDRWNSWGGNNFGWNSYSTVNNFYGNGFGAGGWGAGGFGATAFNPYCPYPTTSNGSFRNTNLGTSNGNTVVTPRRRANTTVVNTNTNVYGNRPAPKIGRGESTTETKSAARGTRVTRKAANSSYRDRVKTRKYSTPKSSTKSYNRSSAPKRSTRSYSKPRSSSSSSKSFNRSSSRSFSKGSSSRARRPR